MRVTSGLLLAVAAACQKIPEPPPQAAKPALEQASPAPAASPPPATPPTNVPAEPPPEFPKPGWSELSMRDSLPICVFSDISEREKALGVGDVKPKKLALKAGQKLVFGVFPPWCLNDACDARVNLQCYVDEQAEAIVVGTRFFSFHKDGASCSEGCLEVDSSCETSELKPGKYTIRHGDKSYPLQIPGSLRDPCLNRP